MEISASLLLEFGLILAVLTIIGGAARRVDLSPVPLYLLAGLVLGDGGIAPVPASAAFVEAGASIGVVLLLLVLGLEFTVGEFTVSARRHLPSALVDIGLNALPGAARLAARIRPGGDPGARGRDLRLVLGHRRATARRPRPARPTARPQRSCPARPRGLRDGRLPSGPRRAGGRGQLGPRAARRRAGGRRHHRRLRGVPPMGKPHRSAGRAPRPRELLLRVLALTLVVVALAELMHVSAAVGAFLVGLSLVGSAADRIREVLTPLRDLFRGNLLPRDRPVDRPGHPPAGAPGRAGPRGGDGRHQGGHRLVCSRAGVHRVPRPMACRYGADAAGRVLPGDRRPRRRPARLAQRPGLGLRPHSCRCRPAARSSATAALPRPTAYHRGSHGVGLVTGLHIPDLPHSARFVWAASQAASADERRRARSRDRWRSVVAMQATWGQLVAELVVFSNDFASRRERPRRPWATSTRQACRMPEGGLLVVPPDPADLDVVVATEGARRTGRDPTIYQDQLGRVGYHFAGPGARASARWPGSGLKRARPAPPPAGRSRRRRRCAWRPGAAVGATAVVEGHATV